MDKILALLKEAKTNISEADLEVIKIAFNEAVDDKVKEESAMIAEKANKYSIKKIDESVNEKVEDYKSKLEKISEAYCMKKALTIAKKADKKVNEQMKKLEAAAQKYIVEYFDVEFDKKYEEELQAIEENVLRKLDEYLEYAITEKIDSKLIKTAAVNETFSPIIRGIQNLFEEQFVPLNLTGKKRLKVAMNQNIELQKSLKKQLDENMKLSEKAESLAKDKLIAEKTFGLSNRDASKLKRMFETKSYRETLNSIDEFRGFLDEGVTSMRNTNPLMTERKKPLARRRVFLRDDDTKDFVNEKFKNEDISQDDSFLTSVTRFMD